MTSRASSSGRASASPATTSSRCQAGRSGSATGRSSQSYGTIWDYADSLDRLRALDVPVLAVKGTETTGDDAAIVDDLAATVPHGRVLELPGDHACHIQNMDRFLAELAGHTAAVHA